MAYFGISIVEKLIGVIGSKLIKEICSGWGYQSELEQLEKTIITIKAVLVDAEALDDLSMAERRYISELKDAVYDADDLFDEFFTLAKLNEIDGNKRGKFSFNKNKSSQAKQISQRILLINKRFDTIAADYDKFSFYYKPFVWRREETCSYVNVEDIIGRDSDKKAILDVLLDPSDSDDICVLSIVGVGGLGKTALAQLVFQDIINIQNNEFLLLWVCVADQYYGGQFDGKTILCKILNSNHVKLDSDTSIKLVKNKFQKKFRAKKYFLVLDDVWNEDHEKWLELEEYLRMGQRGSKIVVTTRSKKTASIIGSKHVHELQGLSHKDSLRLFEMTAFGETKNDPELVEMGKSIVKKCYNNPLVIKVVGSHLHGQEKRMWELIEKSGLLEVKEGGYHILDTLKLSYKNLITPSLKDCFIYCSVFPKDFEMDKDMLISLWLAQGYIVPLVSGQTIEDAAEESFLIFLQRDFFKDVKKDKWGDVKSVKLHDIMHEIAQKMSGEETCVVTSRIANLNEKICRHVYVDNEYEGHLKCNTRIHSYFSRDLTDKQVEDMRALRALALCSSCLSLPSSLDKLMLLRYIKLDSANLLSLPDSITRLYNLQSLILHCIRLRELPIDIGNLINLRHLDISHCASLIGIPLTMEKLTNLAVLPCFVVGYGDSNAELKILQAFTGIKGELHIKIRKIYGNVDGISETEGINLKNMNHLSYLNMEFKEHCIDQGDVFKKLQLPPNLKGLTLQWYKGTTTPWLSQVSFVLPHHLVRIEIIQCHKLEQLPVLSKLPNLKSLFLDMLNSVEYLEDVNSSGEIQVAEFFPSLESLEIRWMSKLKGWWKGNEEGMRFKSFPRLSFISMAFCPEFTSLSPDNLSELQLPCLRELRIDRCGKFASNLVCPILEKLNLDKINENLLITCENSQVDVVIKNKVNDLKSVRTFCLTGLTISNCIDSEVKNFSEFKKKFEKSCCSSLLTLVIEDCEFIRRLSGLEHLTVLQELTLDYNQQLIINEDDEEPWKSFHKSLRKLKFSSLRRMKSLPKGMQHLNFLEHLVLHDCKNLEGLPQWLSCLSSLESMEIYDCPGIKSFPEAIKDLFSLNNLSIYGCPDLEKSCREDSEKIENITNVSYAKPSREEFFLRR